MKRGVLIAIAVLIPFAFLIAFGFSRLAEQPTPVAEPIGVPVLPPAPLERSREKVAPPPPPPPVAVAPTAVPAAAPAPEFFDPSEDAPPNLLDEMTRRPALKAVNRLVRQCFDDARDRTREPQRVTVTFETTDAGRFDHVVIKKSSWPDPQVTACVLDSFEEARFEGPNRPLKHQAVTFTFSPADAGR